VSQEFTLKTSLKNQNQTYKERYFLIAKKGQQHFSTIFSFGFCDKYHPAPLEL